MRITLEGSEDSVSPLRWRYEDAATPYEGQPGGGHALKGDGYLDLLLFFDSKEVTQTLELRNYVDQTIPLMIIGRLKEEFDSTLITGQDYVWVLNLRSGKGSAA